MQVSLYWERKQNWGFKQLILLDFAILAEYNCENRIEITEIGLPPEPFWCAARELSVGSPQKYLRIDAAEVFYNFGKIQNTHMRLY